MSFHNIKFSRFYFPGIFMFFSFLMSSCEGKTPDFPDDNHSAYITCVFDYVYAPGQHAQLAKSSDGANFIGKPSNDKAWLYLGGFGGYVVAGFNHNVENGDGADFEVYALPGAMPEPAVVYVMSDDNADGKPNETWYELKGNQFDNSRRNYWVRYYKAVSETDNVTWKDSEGSRGELISGFGGAVSASWWWNSTLTDSITFSGTRLPDAYDNSSSAETQYWVVPTGRYTCGYAENQDGTDFDKMPGTNKLDISNAVNVDGSAKVLANIRFIKVQTGVFQRAGWTNEVSSEVRGARDLRE